MVGGDIHDVAISLGIFTLHQHLFADQWSHTSLHNPKNGAPDGPTACQVCSLEKVLSSAAAKLACERMALMEHYKSSAADFQSQKHRLEQQIESLCAQLEKEKIRGDWLEEQVKAMAAIAVTLAPHQTAPAALQQEPGVARTAMVHSIEKTKHDVTCLPSPIPLSPRLPAYSRHEARCSRHSSTSAITSADLSSATNANHPVDEKSRNADTNVDKTAATHVTEDHESAALTLIINLDYGEAGSDGSLQRKGTMAGTCPPGYHCASAMYRV